MSKYIDFPNMLLIGSLGRKSGKTLLATSLIKRYLGDRRVIGLKVSTVHENNGVCLRGGKGCGVCTSFQGPFVLTEEKDLSNSKDTSKMLSAGARKVYWLRAKKMHLFEGMQAMMKLIHPTDIVVCESNSVRLVVRPGVFVMAKNRASKDLKTSALTVLQYVDKIVTFNGIAHNLALDEIGLTNTGFFLRKSASALVLAGGKSGRMGFDKSLLKVRGVTIIERIIRQLNNIFPEVLVSANDIEKYAFLGLPVVQDGHHDVGPLAGIAAGLKFSANKLMFVTACDIPEIDLGFVETLQSNADDHEIVVPMTGNGNYEPLHAFYCRSILAKLEILISQGVFKIIELYSLCKTARIEIPEKTNLLNLNTREEYLQYVSVLTSGIE